MLSSIIIGLAVQLHTVVGQCFQDPSMNAEWAQIINEDETSTTFDIEGSCCQETVCGIPCAEPTPAPAKVRHDCMNNYTSHVLPFCKRLHIILASILAQSPPLFFLSIQIIQQGFAIAVMVAICIFVVVGFATIFLIKGEAENFFVGGRSFPLWVCS